MSNFTIPTDLILDGNNLAFRASYTPHPPMFVNDVDISGVRQLIRMLVSYCKQFQPIGNIYMVWDKRIQKDVASFRKGYSEVDYKQTRDYDKHARVFEDMDLAMGIVPALGIRNMFPWSLEGDDVIAWLSKNACERAVIVSSDNDLWQLITPQISCFEPTRKQLITVDNFEVYSPVPLQNYVLYKCIVGDVSDNVKGLNRYGKVKGANLATSGDLSGLDDQQHALLERNLQLMDLNYGLKISEQDVKAFQDQMIYHSKMTNLNVDKFIDKCNELGITEYNTEAAKQQLLKLFGQNAKTAQLRKLMSL